MKDIFLWTIEQVNKSKNYTIILLIRGELKLKLITLFLSETNLAT